MSFFTVAVKKAAAPLSYNVADSAPSPSNLGGLANKLVKQISQVQKKSDQAPSITGGIASALSKLVRLK